MTKEQRQPREREDMKKMILQAAALLIAKDGIEKLSIRKIAERIEYSPGIIYHYFQGKDEIVVRYLQQKYTDMVAGLQSVQRKVEHELPAETLLRQSLEQMIKMTLSTGVEYRNVMLNDTPAVLNYTAVLFKGAAQERKAIGMLCQCLSRFESKALREESSIELTAQVIWSAAFGLIMRLIVEKDLPEEQVEVLTSCYLDSMVAIAIR
ncbi:helix-turn-helix domain-containing protein [Paenibacillus sp.]|uniref:TetR/AcrR family transcriptional regulator n=1 Tax=Paenibacillus sp. TaxID=58172 RepID=UPI0028A915C4|nr:helix-turn-helix domain-containing protein [Paenibacillus sp.]